MSVWRRLRAIFARARGRRQDRERELDRELASHLEAEAEEQREAGLTSEEAYFAARRHFGNATLVKEEVREIERWIWADRFARHLKYGARSLRKSPGFTAVAVLTLALGIGANAAIFSAINALILRSLPFPDADQLVRIYSTKDGVPIVGFAYPGGPSAPDMHDFAENSRSFQKMTVYDTWGKSVSFGGSAGAPEWIRVGLVQAGYFEVLGVEPIMGWLFTEEEGHEGKQYVAAISASVWRNRFGGDSAILGRTIRINAEPYTIVAVMPDVIPNWMELKGLVGVWTPLATPDLWSESSRGSRGYGAIARMKPGVTIELARAELETIAARLAATHEIDRGIGVQIKPILDTRVGTLRPMLILLMGAVTLILLIACVNLANLLLARNSARRRELAVRAALGAGRGGLVQQLFSEALLLSFAGGAVGIAAAKIALASLSRMHPENLPQLSSVGMDGRVLAFTFAVSVVTSVIFGVAPALSGSRMNLADALKQGGRSGTVGRASQQLRDFLVVTEMAMSLMLLVGATLLVRSVMRLEGQSLGIRQDHLLKGRIYLPPIRYPEKGVITRFSDAFGARVRSLPGVIDATVTTLYPPHNGWPQMLEIPGHTVSRIQDIPSAQFGVADAHFLQTIGLPLIRGRDFSGSDTATSPAVALISEELKRLYFPGQDPIGRRIHIGPPPFLHMAPGENNTDDMDVTIIGVTGDLRNAGLSLPPKPQIVVLYCQHPLVNYGFKDIVIRTAADPKLVVPEIRRQLAAMDSDLPFAEVQTIDELVEEQTGGQRFTTALLAAFAAAGLALAVVGIYGVISFLVTQRKQELAVRMALGASYVDVLRMVILQGVKMAACGAAIGLVGAWAAQKLMRGLLFGTSPVDPVAFAGGATFLLIVAAVACAIPGMRVLWIDPASALREE